MPFVSGGASLTLGDDRQEAAAGTWVHMPARRHHSVRAKTPVAMLLLLLNQVRSAAGAYPGSL
jgi:quercetin dioxygenase-like cupin family protein